MTINAAGGTKKILEMHEMLFRCFALLAIAGVVAVVIGFYLMGVGNDISERTLQTDICGEHVCTSSTEHDAYVAGRVPIYEAGLTFFFVGGCCFVIATPAAAILWVKRNRESQ